MRSLLMKDLYCIRGYMKQMAFILLFMSMMAVVLRSPSLVCFFLVFACMSLVISCMNIDEKNKWERYALTLPIRKRDIVKSKYLLLLLMGAAAEILSILLNLLICVLFDSSSVQEAVVSSLVVFFVYFYIFSFTLPVVYRYGADKARYVMMAVVLIPTVGFSLLFRLFPQLENISVTSGNVFVLCALAAALAAVLYLISYQLSLKVYEKKEF